MLGSTKIHSERQKGESSAFRRNLSMGRRKDLVRMLTRLNHILVPDTAADRDRLRKKRWVKFLGGSATIFHGFTREGRALWLLSFPIGLASLNVRFEQVHLLFSMIVGLLFTSWLLRPLFKAKNIHATVRVPNRVVAHQSVVFQVEVLNTTEAPLDNIRLILPFLPWDGKWLSSTVGLATLAPGARGTIEARATFQARGEHHLDRFQLGLVVPLGLTVGRLLAIEGARFTVVPPIANVSDVTHDSRISQAQGSCFDSLDRGEAELGGVRPYRFGDPLKHLHARTWARTGRPHVREFLTERQDRNVLAVLCAGREQSERCQEAAISLAAGVAARLTLSGAGLDTLILDESRFQLRPRLGTAALDSVLDRLATHQFDNSLTQVSPIVRRHLRDATSAVIVTTGSSRNYSAIIEELRAGGVGCKWVHIGDDEEHESQSPTARHLRVETVESGREIRI